MLNEMDFIDPQPPEVARGDTDLPQSIAPESDPVFFKMTFWKVFYKKRRIPKNLAIKYPGQSCEKTGESPDII